MTLAEEIYVVTRLLPRDEFDPRRQMRRASRVDRLQRRRGLAAQVACGLAELREHRTNGQRSVARRPTHS
jgi:hypothetical protein